MSSRRKQRAPLPAALGLAATAAANPFDTGADAVVNNLQGQGYNVQGIGAGTVPLSQCSGIHPSNLDQSFSFQEKQHTVVEVDVSCPSN